MNMNLIGEKLWSTCAKQRNDILGVILIALLMFLPLSTRGNLIRFTVTAVLFGILLTNKTIKIKMPVMKLLIAMFLSIVIPAITVFFVEKNIDINTWLHEVQRIIFYVLLILIVLNYKITFKHVYIICILVLIFHTTVQTLQWMGFEWVNDLIRQYYLQPGDSGIHLMLASPENAGLDFRSGSIYMNPNVYMVIPATILCVILQANILKFSLINYIWIIMALFSLLLTGSRTTFFVAAAVVGIYVLVDKNTKKAKWIILVGLAIAVLFFGDYFKEQFRVFQLSEGMESSLEVKLDGFKSYLQNAPVIYFLTGSLSSSLQVHIDSEWGYIYSYFGVLGIYWYICFLRLMSRNKEILPFQVLSSTIVICLIAISATVVLCMPVFTFFCLISLVKIEFK